MHHQHRPFAPSRRDWLRSTVGAAACLLVGRDGWADDAENTRTADPAAGALQRGLAWLVENQNAAGDFKGGKHGGDPAIVGLAGRAMLAAGGIPGRGKYGDALDRCVSYLTAADDESGYLANPTPGVKSSMYGHGYAAAFLAEAFHAAMNDRLRASLERAVKLLVAAQSPEGGWRYVPRREAGADVSVTACQLVALAAAERAGIDVPDETIASAVRYINSCQNADGGFRYLAAGGSSGVPRSAAALAALEAAGRSMREELEKARAYLRERREYFKDARSSHFAYAAYYAVQSMCRTSNPSAPEWRDLLRDVLVSAQQPDGSWSDSIGPAYGTAGGCFVLAHGE